MRGLFTSPYVHGVDAKQDRDFCGVRKPAQSWCLHQIWPVRPNFYSQEFHVWLGTPWQNRGHFLWSWVNSSCDETLKNICCLQTVMNNLNPRFSKHFAMDYIFEQMQELRLVVCDYDSTSNHDFLVRAHRFPHYFGRTECHWSYRGYATPTSVTWWPHRVVQQPWDWWTTKTKTSPRKVPFVHAYISQRMTNPVALIPLLHPRQCQENRRQASARDYYFTCHSAVQQQ